MKPSLPWSLVDDDPALAAVTAKYPMAITSAMAALIEPGVTYDPIARQFVADARELETTPEERADPIGDAAHSPVPGIVHRHADRVLFKPVLTCPVYCRFCFRREQVGQGSDGALSPAATDAALAYIASHPEIREVIFTGGDPFILSPRRIAELSQRLAAIPHVTLLRWHTRVPVVDPARVSDELVAALLAPNVTTWVALHANHLARIHARGARRHRPPDRCRHSDGFAKRAAEGRQRRYRHAGRLDAHLPRKSHQALLPAPSRPCARHIAFPPADRGWAGADACIARAHHRPWRAGLRARYPRRLRQGLADVRKCGTIWTAAATASAITKAAGISIRPMPSGNCRSPRRAPWSRGTECRRPSC